MAPKPHICKENVILPFAKLFVDDLVFVGNGDVPGHKCISEEQAKRIPAGYLEPALDADVQSATKQKADEALAKAEARLADARNAVELAEHDLKVHTDRETIKIKNLAYQAGLAEQDLKAEQDRHAQTLKAFGIEPEKQDDKKAASKKK